MNADVFDLYEEEPERAVVAPPSALGAAGKALWREFEGSARRPEDRWVVLDEGELVILRKACELEDIAARLRDLIADADLVVRGSAGNQIVHPAIPELRQILATQRSMLNGLRPPQESASGGGKFTSQTARRAAEIKWAGRRG